MWGAQEWVLLIGSLSATTCVCLYCYIRRNERGMKHSNSDLSLSTQIPDEEQCA